MEIDEGVISGAVGLAESIENDLEEIITVPSNHYALRAPDPIKKLNPAAYKPRLVSIGPVFHGQPELQPMEAFKKRYAKYFIENYDVKIKKWINMTKEHEQSLLEAYGINPSEISSHEFVKIMIIDGAFLVEFLSRHFNGSFEERDRMTHKKWNTIRCDLLLLENQIPCSYLHKLCHLAFELGESVSNCDCFYKLLYLFLDEEVLPQFVAGQYQFKRWDDAYEPKHLLDFLTMSMPYNELKEASQKLPPLCHAQLFHNSAELESNSVAETSRIVLQQILNVELLHNK